MVPNHTFGHNCLISFLESFLISTSILVRALTNTDGSQTPDGFVGRGALGEEGLGGVRCEGEADDGNRTRPDNQTFGPKTDEPHEGAEGVEDVGVVAAGLLDHAAQLGVAVRAHHGEEAAS